MPFNAFDSREMALRSPVAYPASLRCPLQLYYGLEESDWLEEQSKLMIRLANAFNKQCAVTVVPADHWSAAGPAMVKSIKFFRGIE